MHAEIVRVKVEEEVGEQILKRLMKDFVWNLEIFHHQQLSEKKNECSIQKKTVVNMQFILQV
jgi:hypothetical protein